MADNTLAESLFEAINLIASKKVSDLPYDKTVVCTITDNTNASQNEYTVSDKTSSFIVYSENTEYSVNSQVYVTIPNGDMQNKKYISGLYISDDNGDYVTYVSPMNSFVDLTGDLTNDQYRETIWSLLANDTEQNKTVAFVWDSGLVSYRNFTCLGVQADFMSLFNNAEVSSGNYGLAIMITYKTENGATNIRTMYMDSSDMYGNPYCFSVYYLQEKLFNIEDLYEITNITVQFYQDNNFKLTDGTDVPYYETITANGQSSVKIFDDNLFVKNFHIKLGELLTVYKDDTVKLICNEDMKYRLDKLPLERHMYARWIHKIDDTLRVIDEDADISLDKSLVYDENKPNFIVHWYHRKLANGVHDELAGNFWEEIENNGSNIYNYSRIPDNTVQVDKYKVIIEYPIKSVKIAAVLNGSNEEYNIAYQAVKSKLETSTSWTPINRVIQGWLEPTEELGYDEAEELYNSLINDQAAYPASYNSSELANLKSCISSILTVNYYESNQLEFENEIQVDLENVDLVQGLQIIVDSGADGLNGIYRLYDETNEIMNSAEARKQRTMTATYTSIAMGDTSLTQAEEIFWCIPVENTMIAEPQAGVDYTDNDDFFYVDQLDEDSDVNSAQNQRYEYAAEHRESSYEQDLQMSIEEIEEAMLHEISLLDSSNYSSSDTYAKAIQEIHDYYNQVMNYALNRDYKEQLKKLPNCKYAIIHRLGGELIEDKDEQLIEVNQTFKIKNYYVENATNNTIFCMIKKYGRIYMAESTLHFGTAGTSGTEATLLLHLIGENGYEVQALPYGGSVTVVPSLYDYNNQRIDFESSGVGYKWFIPPKNEEAITLTTVGTQCVITSNDDCDLLDHAHAILQATTKYNIYKPAATDSEDATGTTRAVTLTVYLPLAIAANDYISSMTGTTRIVYDTNGTNPAYYKEKYQLFTGPTHQLAQATSWELWCGEDNTELLHPTTRKYYPTITTEGELLPTNMYYSGLSPITVLGYALDTEDETELAWIQPLLIMQNRYGSPMLNDWDGSLVMDEENGTILSAMVGAGIKNDDNTFSGVLMGNVALADEKIGNKTGLGMYGYHHGEQSFGLNVDGTAFFGKAGSGRITFDGNKGLIQSYNFVKPHSKTVLDEDGELLPQEDGAAVNTRTVTTGAGVQLDLDDSTFSAYGATGAILIDANTYGKPLFTIQDANENTLFYVSSNSYDPVRGKQYDAKYYLQSSNYTSVDPSDEGLEEYSTGALFDLEKGRLNIHGKAGRVSIDGNGDTTLFQIKGWKADSDSGELLKNVLMNVSPSKYYLQSLDYKANTKGFKLDLANGKIQASGFALKAGTDATGKIQINTNGAPYFSVTSGTDYVEEEVEENGTTVTHYVCYDAIDLSNASAQFLYDPNDNDNDGVSMVYYYENPRESGYYILEDYWGEQVNELADLGSNPDADDLKTQWYYRLNSDGTSYSQVVGKMWPESTMSFTDSLLPDAEKIYVVKDAPIGPDPYSFYQDKSTGIHYFVDAAGTMDITDIIRDPNEVYNYKAMVQAKRLYRQPRVPLPAAGTAWEEGRDYYELIDNEYVSVKNVVKDHDTCTPWVAKQYYFRTDFGMYMPSIQAYSGAQTYYTPNDKTRVGDNCYGYDKVNNKLKREELSTLTDDMFTPTEKTIVIPSAYFYDTPSTDAGYKTLYYYSVEWEEVPQDAAYDANTYRYGLKFSGSDRIFTGYDVVGDNVPIYQAGKYYIQDPSEYTYEQLTTWKQLSCTGNNPKNYYYKLWYDLYVKCDKVIQTENNTNGWIFHPNTYYEYVANKPYLPLKEYDISLKPFYKLKQNKTEVKAANLETVTLCDLNEQPFSVVYATVTSRSVTGNYKKAAPKLTYRSAHVLNSALYYVNSNGELVAANGTFKEGAEYYIRYDFGLTSPEEWGANSSSVKLINITKSRFELKSHNWNMTTPSGMYFYLSSHSEMEKIGQVNATLSASEDENDQATRMTQINESHEVGGGFIQGYGYYKAATADSNGSYYRFPQFILDWRAGFSHYPISVNGEAFRVWWNGRVDMNDLHAYSGRIGRWYIDNDGIYSYNPYVSGNRSGVALVALGMERPGDNSDVFTVPNTTPAKTVTNTDLRITVGQFKVTTTTTTENGADEDGNDTSISFTSAALDQPGFAVYKNGLMVAYGAIIRAGEITDIKIENANITTGKIGGFEIRSDGLYGLGTSIKRSGITTNNLKATGGKIAGWTISSNKLSGGTLECTSGLIGGWTINADSLTKGSASLSSDSLKIGDSDIHDGGITANGTELKIMSGMVWCSPGFTSPGGFQSLNDGFHGGTFEGTTADFSGALTAQSADFGTGAVTGGAATFSSLSIGEGSVQMEVAGCTISDLKTALGLKALAYSESVTKKVKPTLTGTLKIDNVGGGSITITLTCQTTSVTLADGSTKTYLTSATASGDGHSATVSTSSTGRKTFKVSVSSTDISKQFSVEQTGDKSIVMYGTESADNTTFTYSQAGTITLT